MAVSALINRLNVALRQIERSFDFLVFRQFPPESFALVGVEEKTQIPSKSHAQTQSWLNEAFLWAVPKHRRSAERNMTRRFGSPEYHWKIIKPKTNLKTCNVCGDDYEAGCLCPSCYKKVIDETKLMQETIQENLQLEPVEKEIVVLYDGEKDSKPDEYFEGKRIIEMNKERPAWFSKNLLQQTTQKPATTTDVKPSELG